MNATHPFRIVSHCDSSNEDYNAECDYVVVELTKDLAELALRRIEALRRLRAEDEELWEMYFWGCHCDWFSTSKEFEELRDPESGDSIIDILWHQDSAVLVADEAEDAIKNATLGKGIRLLRIDFTPAEDVLQRTECDQMIVREDEIAFVAIPKHTDIYVTTRPIPVGVLEAAAGRKISVPLPHRGIDA